METPEENQPVVKKKQGFATMDLEKRRAIASIGGKKISSNAQHMSEIGRKGGIKSGGRKKERKANEQN